MGFLVFCLVVLVSYCSIHAVLGAAGEDAETDPCRVLKSIRFKNEAEGNGTIRGRVQVCEKDKWRNLCDSDWTRSDAQVACRSLKFSSIGAQNSTKNQAVGGTYTTMEVECNGSEGNISDCKFKSNGITGAGGCAITINLQCYKSNNHTSSQTTDLGSISSPTSAPTSIPNTQQSTKAYFSATKSNGTTSPTLSDSENENSNSLLKPPNLYYFIVGVAAVVMAVMLLVLVMIIFCCCGRPKSKGISPYDHEKQDGFTKEKDSTRCLEVVDEESTKIKDGDDLMHHQLQQSSPIYEAIQSNESSSTPHSQESPSSRSAVVATNSPQLPPPPPSSELYSVLKSTDTYSQLEVHIPTSTPTTTEPFCFDSDYQQLDHKASSLKRIRATTIHAINRSAVGVAQGFLKEEEFLEQDTTPRYASFSLPRDARLSSHRPTLLHNRSLERPNLELQPRFDDDRSSNVEHNSEKENFYQTIESPPDYASLKELDEVSEDVFTDDIASNMYENSVCSSHPLTCHSPECPDNSGPATGLHTSTQSSPTCSHSSSSSTQISRAFNGTPLVSRDVKLIAHKYTENSELPGKNMGSKIAYTDAKSNRFPGHFDNTVQSDQSDMYTLV